MFPSADRANFFALPRRWAGAADVKKSEEFREQALEYLTKARSAMSAAEQKAKDEKRDGPTGEERAEVRKHLDAHDAAKAAYEQALSEERDSERLSAGDEWEKKSEGRKSAAGQGRAAPATGGRTAPASDEQRALATQAWFRRNSRRKFPLTDEHRAACEACNIDPNDSELILSLHRTEDAKRSQAAWCDGPRQSAERRTLSSITASSGGAATYPESMVNQLEINMLAYGGILQAAEIIRTDTREPMRWPTFNDTSNKGRRIGESAAVAQLDPSFAAKVWNAYKYTSDEVLVPYELLTGTPFDLPGVIGAMLGVRIGRKLADDLTTGTGIDQPTGIVTEATTVSAASATAIGWDDLETLITAVDPEFRVGAAFMFHDSVRANLKKQRDSMGRPMWMDTNNSTEPDNLKGYPWFINQSMQAVNATAPITASGQKTILFGQLSKYKVRQVREVRFYRLLELNRRNDQDSFVAFYEADGKTLSAGTAPIKVLTH